MTEGNIQSRFILTGDIHGSHSIRKLSSKNFHYNDITPPLTKNDYLIITGDFGLIFFPEGSQYDKEDKYWLRWLEEKPWTTLFVDGNHESFPRLNLYPEEMWNGGRVHRISDSIFHLMRGQVFTIDDKKFFVVGGGRSHDIEFRTKDVDWWEQEIPSKEERDEAVRNLEKHDWKVDYVITHDAPTSIANRLIDSPDRKPDEFTDWLEKIANNLEFNQWFFGHHHKDEELMDGMFQAMYHDIAVVR